MKRTLFFIALVVTVQFSFSQELANYADPSPEELEMKVCSFDKDAGSVMLLNEAFSDYDDEHHLITRHHIRIKILKEKDLNQANVSIPYYRKDDFEIIDDIAGLTINSNGSGDPSRENIDPKTIFKQNTNEQLGEVRFAFPAVKKGSIIEYRYRSTMKHYGGLEDWEFQQEIPVVLSKYKLVITPNTEFTYRITKRDDLQITVKPNSSDGSIYFEMKNIPGLNEEPYMDARNDYVQKVIFQLSGYNSDGTGFGRTKYMNSWDAVTNELINDENFGKQLGKNLSGTDDFIKQTKLLSSDEAKMKAVYDYVARNMNWNGFHSKYSMDGVKQAWSKRTGNKADINLILVNLLKDAELTAYPMLVSERYHGKVNTDYPFIDQFSSIFACVVINGKKYYLDATDKFTPARLTPYEILNTSALLVNRKAGGLINISNDSLQYQEDINVSMEVNEDGTLKGTVTVEGADYARSEKLEDSKEDLGILKKSYADNQPLAVNIGNFEIRNQDKDSLALLENFSFTGTLNSSGGYTFVPLNLFSGFQNNPFVADERFSNVNFGYKKTITVVSNIKLPKNYTVDDVPKRIKVVTPEQDIIFLREIVYNKESSSVDCTLKFEFKKSLYLVDDYPLLKEIYKKIFEYLKEPLLLKKQ
ncbi:MAG: DUF3857 domain-containing protein [Ferruginibacter sp.]